MLRFIGLPHVFRILNNQLSIPQYTPSITCRVTNTRLSGIDWMAVLSANVPEQNIIVGFVHIQSPLPHEWPYPSPLGPLNLQYFAQDCKFPTMSRKCKRFSANQSCMYLSCNLRQSLTVSDKASFLSEYSDSNPYSGVELQT